MNVTPVYHQLIEALRTDEHTRTHFTMNQWKSSSCPTVGCIAGTAVGISNEGFMSAAEPTISDMAARILGLQENGRRVFMCLFLPDRWIEFVRSVKLPEYLNTLSHNERPDLETVEKMIEFAGKHKPDRYDNYKMIYKAIGPDEAATCLENLLEIPQYVNWQRAVEEVRV